MRRHRWNRRFSEVTKDKLQYTAITGYVCEHCGVEVELADLHTWRKDARARGATEESDALFLLLDVLVDAPGGPIVYE